MSSTPESITQDASPTDGTASTPAFLKPARNDEDASAPTEIRALREALLRGARHRAAWERAHEVAERLLDRPGGRDPHVERTLLGTLAPDLRDELQDALVRRQLMRARRL